MSRLQTHFHTKAEMTSPSQLYECFFVCLYKWVQLFPHPPFTFPLTHQCTHKLPCFPVRKSLKDIQREAADRWGNLLFLTTCVLYDTHSLSWRLGACDAIRKEKHIGSDHSRVIQLILTKRCKMSWYSIKINAMKRLKIGLFWGIFCLIWRNISLFNWTELNPL